MTRKTEIINASSGLLGEDAASVIASLTTAINNLELEGRRLERDVLFDTLEISIDREFMDDRVLSGSSSITQTYSSIYVNAQAVRIKK